MDPGSRRLAQFCQRRRHAGEIAAEGLPHRDRGRRAAAESPLRKACERARTAVAIGCYPDGERDLAKLIDDELRVSNLRIAPDARAALTALLGGDRQASRNELRKLALYAHGKREVTLDDVMAVVADASELKIDPIVDGAFAGKPGSVETEFAKAMIAGTYPGMIISAAQRQAAWLHKSALAIAGNAAIDLARQRISAPALFTKGNVETALRNFNAARLLGSSISSRSRRWTCASSRRWRRDRAAHAAVDRGKCEAAGMIGVIASKFTQLRKSRKRLFGVDLELHDIPASRWF